MKDTGDPCRQLCYKRLRLDTTFTYMHTEQCHYGIHRYTLLQHYLVTGKQLDNNMEGTLFAMLASCEGSTSSHSPLDVCIQHQFLMQCPEKKPHYV